MTALFSSIFAALRTVAAVVLMVVLIALGSTVGLALNGVSAAAGFAADSLNGMTAEMAADLFGARTVTTFRALRRR